jgi:aspartate aminotransferase
MAASRLSSLAQSLRGSVIMQIAGDVRALVEQGKPIANLTVGDFDPKQFPIPKELEESLIAAIRGGETNYPNGIGMDSLRRAVRDFYRRRAGLEFGVENIVVGSGIRPAIYAVYRAVVDPGDRVVFGVPQWNNDYYVEMMGAEMVAIDCDASTNFLPTVEALRPVIRGARLLALNSPLNPTGTMFTAEQLRPICDLVLEENARRGATERPLFVMYDQVYWLLNPGGVPHVDPISLRPAMRDYSIYVDGISKCFAATGLRVGWAVAPTDLVKPMNDVIGHAGAWAPRAEQIAAAHLLDDDAALDRYLPVICASVKERTDAVYNGICALRDEGMPVEAVRPQGAIYVSARFGLHGMQTPDGTTLETDDDVRRYLLNTAGLGAIPFAAFGTKGDRGWFRISVGVISVEQIEALMPRLHSAIEALEGEPVSSA